VGVALLAMFATTAQAAPNDPALSNLGRIFTTPAERVAIERAAAGQTGPDGSPRIDGVMHRSAGPAVVWENGVPRYLETTAVPQAAEVAQ
jgi:hypothetical protein